MSGPRHYFQAALIAVFGGVFYLMDVILHLGAHRTGTTTLQVFLENNRDNLNEIGTEFWGPNRTRSGLFSGLIKNPSDVTHDAVLRGERSSGLIRMEMDRLAHSQVKSLIVSEENMIGVMGNNLGVAGLYPDAKARLDRFTSAFGSRCKRIALSIRSYDKYWTSVFAFSIERGRAAPSRDLLDHLVTQPRRWRNIICEISQVFPNAELIIWPFEGFIGQVDQQLAVLNGAAVPNQMRGRGNWHNPSAGIDKLRQVFIDRGEHAYAADLTTENARWQPFDNNHLAAFRDQYEEDIDWLRGGADGIAKYIEKPDSGLAEKHLHPAVSQRGQINEPEERNVG